MQENNQISCRFLVAVAASFDEMLSELLNRYNAQTSGIVPVRFVFFGSPASNEEYCTHITNIQEAVRNRYGEKAPGISYVSQPPCGGGLTLEIHEFKRTDNDVVEYKSVEDITYVICTSFSGRSLFLSGVAGNCLRESISSQSDAVFRRIGAVLRAEQMPVCSIVRQWNYIEKITAFTGNRQHYQDFNDSRTHFYNQTPWENGYPAATGIGTKWGGIVIDLNAFLPSTANVSVQRIDNPLQIAAHAYSQQVLKGEEDKVLKTKTTPKFERAKAVEADGHGLIYISGTAAIRGEQSLENVGLEKQTVTTLENIECLISRATMEKYGIVALSDGKPTCFRVYLKQAADYEVVRRIVEERYPDLPVVYTLADVCRTELIIEIEGLATF